MGLAPELKFNWLLSLVVNTDDYCILPNLVKHVCTLHSVLCMLHVGRYKTLKDKHDLQISLTVHVILGLSLFTICERSTTARMDSQLL